MIAGLIICASLTVVDGDTVKCDGQNMRLLVEGFPFVSGIDTPEIGSHAECRKELKLALIAKGRRYGSGTNPAPIRQSQLT